jgi:hypothetical protein
MRTLPTVGSALLAGTHSKRNADAPPWRHDGSAADADAAQQNSNAIDTLAHSMHTLPMTAPCSS